MIVSGAAAAAAGTAGVMAVQIHDAGVSAATLWSSSLGRAVVERALPVALMVVLAVLLFTPIPRKRIVGMLTAVAALGAMAADVLNSHAAAEAPAVLNELVQWLHIAAVGVWIGGLVALVVVLVRTPAEQRMAAARRLSALAAAGLVVVAATGVLRAVVEVRTWSNLVSTGFGLLVLVKSALLVLLAGLGAVNRYGNVPRMPHTLGRLRRVVSAEVVIGFATVTVAAALVNTAPPPAPSPPPPRAQIVAEASDAATTVRLKLVVDPGGAGFNTFTATVADYDSGAPVPATSVTLSFTQPFRPALAPSSLTLARRSAGSFSARGGNLSLPGIWAIDAVVNNGAASAEVHLRIATAGTVPPVTAVATKGLPTLYTVHGLPDGLSAQVYLDPDRAGVDEFHVTFFTPSGNEATVPECAVGMTPGGGEGTPVLLTVRPLDGIGHYVADITAPPGPIRFDILGTGASGEALWTYLIVTPGG